MQSTFNTLDSMRKSQGISSFWAKRPKTDNQNQTHIPGANQVSEPDKFISKKDKIFGATTGLASFWGFKKLAGKLGLKKYSDWVLKGLQNFTKEENAELKKGVQKAFENSGLKEHGVELHDVTVKNYKKVEKIFDKKSKEFANKYFKLDKLIKKMESFQDKMQNKADTISKKHGGKGIKKAKTSLKGKILKPKHMDKTLKIVAEGKNAFFSPFGEIIAVNGEKMAAATFHEMGHALNFNKGGFSKFLNIGRIPMIAVAPLILGIGLLKSNKTNKKGENQKPEGWFAKTTSFIKDNAGKLTFASFIPMLLEEGLASYKGAKLAKGVVSPKLLKKINVMNVKAWSTYLIGAVLTSGLTTLAIKVRDKIAGDEKQTK